MTLFGAVVGKLNVSVPYCAQASAVKRASVSSGNVVTYGKHRLYGHLWWWWLRSFQHFGMECVHVIVPPVAPSTLPPPLISTLLKPSS